MLDKNMINNIRGALSQLEKHANYLVKNVNHRSGKGQEENQHAGSQSVMTDNLNGQGDTDNEQAAMDESIVDSMHEGMGGDQGKSIGNDGAMLPGKDGTILEAHLSRQGKGPGKMVLEEEGADEDNPEEGSAEEVRGVGPRKGMVRLHNMGIPVHGHKRGKFERVY